MRVREVQTRNSALIKLNHELDSFAYSVSHDLKAPLASIQGLLNVARLEKGANALLYYDRIESSVEKLNNFIKDIIDYSKNTRMGVNKEKIKVKKLIEGMIDELTYLNGEKKIRTQIDIDGELEIVADKTRIIFILNNLLTNSINYSDLTKESSYIKISGVVINNEFNLVIEDNGQGIKEKYLPKLFDMFYRANEGSSGSGLGLYIVKESLEKLNGTVKLESTFGIGTKVSVSLPV